MDYLDGMLAKETLFEEILYKNKIDEESHRKKIEPLFLFLYHTNDPITHANYNQLCKIEGSENIQPISDCQGFLPNTYQAQFGAWDFPHWDSYWMCDGLIYKYILNNIQTVLARSEIVIIEYDTWWNFSSSKWLSQSLKEYDVIGAELLEYEESPSWVFFEAHKNLSFAKKMIGLRPFSVICCKSQAIVKAAEYFRNTEELHKVYNNEMRFATACKLSGSKVGEISLPFKNTIKWYEHELKNISQEEGIFHPVKKIIENKNGDK